jgi:L-lysine 2,3-aminomutase
MRGLNNLCYNVIAMTEKELATKTKQQYKKRLAEIKQTSGCADCGEKNHIVLDFDHLRDKKYNVSRMIHDGFSWKAILKEIKKCEVVCANCHRIRTHNRLTKQTA